MMNSLDITAIGPPEPWLIEAAASIGLDLSGLTHETTNYFVNHGIKRHGNAETEKAQGQLPVTLSDIERIPEIVKAPDCAIIGINRHSIPLIAYAKKFEDGTIFYFEEVLNSKKNKALRSRTIFKKMGTVNADKFLKIVTTNAHTDVSGAKMVVGAGGRPDGEA
jgi:hypothetical protein